VSSAEECIGRGYSSSPEWFEENAEILKPLIDNKNEALQKWMPYHVSVSFANANGLYRRLQLRLRKIGYRR